MSKGGKGGGESKPAGNTTVNQAPWIDQQPYLKQGMEAAKNLYENNTPEFYQHQTFANRNEGINLGIGGTRWRAQNDLLAPAAMDQNTNIVNGNYLWANPANGLFSSLSTMNSPEARAFAPFMNGSRLGQTDPALQSYIGGGRVDKINPALQSYLSGERMGKDSPYTQELTDSVLARVLPGIQAQFIRGGSLSSPDAARASSSGAASALAPLLFAREQQEAQNQITAADLYGRQNQQEIQNQIGANDYQHKYQQQEVQNQMTAGDTLGKLRLAAGAGTSNSFQSGMDQMIRGLAAAPGSQGVGYQPFKEALRAGREEQTEDQKWITEQMARWEFEQKQPYEKLKTYMTTIGGMPGGSSTTTPYFQNQTANALGTLTGGIGAANSLFGSSGLLSSGGALGGKGGAAAGAELSSAWALPAAAEAIGGAEILGGAASAAAWIVCTELCRQGKMPKRHYVAGAPVFAAYPEIGKRGYYVWAIPTVRHLRKHPDSLLSRAVGAVFRWRAENIAAHRGVRGARKLWRGAAVTAILYPICKVLGPFVGEQDWASLYREEMETR